jgi:hypothetical protein
VPVTFCWSTDCDKQGQFDQVEMQTCMTREEMKLTELVNKRKWFKLMISKAIDFFIANKEHQLFLVVDK